ncbi:Protein of unknown function (DUF3445) [Seminavis robusta]|uniref:Uncharacterized protein n=1 Tax=Seminavis robusta TaxID=568900 RepID=A0A9N8H9F8_9STRA|nr:Protein of unknown function (DUF3445) [Seminavis robusta]|eukprot:Sro116_g057110.1 Protein of unknown function (DUF3445) (438) ;mRNA; r:64306-65619
MEDILALWVENPREGKGVLVLVAAVSVALLWWWNKQDERRLAGKLKTASTTETTNRKSRGPVCPFSAESNFLVETAHDLPPAPLDLLESWVDPSHPHFGKYPLAARWLEAGISGQDTPGMLRAGLKRLRDSKFFLVEEPFRLQEELALKEKALDDPERTVFVAESDDMCIKAQQECLELFLQYLPQRYPDLYSYNKQQNTIHVKPLGSTFYINDYQERPLELCERIVQEDLVLMRQPKQPEESQYIMSAAAVVFSFFQLAEKLGKPVAFIHAPVPGYQEQLRRTLDLTFDKLLKTESPMWRNNWGLAPSGELDKPLFGETDHANKEGPSFDASTMTSADVQGIFLKVEYQTIRRLPASGYLLFTAKTMTDPMSSLEHTPKAAACLAKSIRGMSPAMRAYKGIENDEICKVVLEYLDSIAGDEQEKAGGKDDVIGGRK